MGQPDPPIGEEIPIGKQTPSSLHMDTTGTSKQAGSTHPTGMHTYFQGFTIVYRFVDK